MNKSEKGFTLIELLVVLALVAILSVVVILTLNPAELLKQARDSNRISDSATIRSAISLYMVDVTSSTIGTSGKCYLSTSAVVVGSYCGGAFASTSLVTNVGNEGVRTVDGNGWVPVNFNAIGSGSPIGQLPVDPVNNSTYFYAYGVNGSPTQLFEIDSKMESGKYSRGGGADIVSTDGGNQQDWYEAGTTLSY